MKKTYQKPMVVVEKFELSQHIAACGLKVETINSNISEACTGTGSGNGSIVTGIFWEVVNTPCTEQFEQSCYASISADSHPFLFNS